MRAEIKHLMTADGDAFDDKFRPTDNEIFSVSLRLIAGPAGGEGEESFDINICTPLWLNHKLQDSDTLIGRHHLFVKSFDYQRIRQAIEKYVSSCSGKGWPEIGLKLARIGYWEFEDYKE